jgi:hypothetical protein
MSLHEFDGLPRYTYGRVAVSAPPAAAHPLETERPALVALVDVRTVEWSRRMSEIRSRVAVSAVAADSPKPESRTSGDFTDSERKEYGDQLIAAKQRRTARMRTWEAQSLASAPRMGVEEFVKLTVPLKERARQEWQRRRAARQWSAALAETGLPEELKTLRFQQPGRRRAAPDRRRKRQERACV